MRARVHGVVCPDGVEIDRAELRASFVLVGTTGRLSVDYRGPVPDLFQSGREVVIEGAMNERGVFEADVLMTKCSSKYEGHNGVELGEPGLGS